MGPPYFGSKKAKPFVQLDSGKLVKKCKSTDAQWNPDTGESRITCTVPSVFATGDVLAVQLVNVAGQDKASDLFTVQ